MMKAFYLLFLWVTLLTPIAYTQVSDEVTLTIQLRASDGTPLAGATIILEQLPDAAARGPECQTDQADLCTWLVIPGLYQVRFPAYSLDDLSSLALAEGGLSGLGVTVGEEAIRYAFTLQTDGHIYFDATPDAAAPTPCLPIETDLSGGVVVSPVIRQTTESVETATPVMLLPGPEKSTLVPPWWLWLGGGVVLGIISWLGAHYWRGAHTNSHGKKG